MGWKFYKGDWKYFNDGEGPEDAGSAPAASDSVVVPHEPAIGVVRERKKRSKKAKAAPS